MSAPVSRAVRIVRICAAATLLLIAAAATAYILSIRAPSWWVDPLTLAEDPLSAAKGSELEQQLAAAISKIRPPAEPWAIRIRDTDINAWIAARLPQWKAHDPALAWPMDGAAVQVRFDEQIATVAIAAEDRVWSASCSVAVIPGAVAITPEGGAIGVLPLPGGAALTLRWLEGDGARTLRLPRTFNLGDGRQVEVLRVKLHAGAVEIECATH